MEIYIIISISFTIMYWWRYTREIILTTRGVEGIRDMSNTLNAVHYTLVTILGTLFLMPMYAYNIINTTRYKYIKSKVLTLCKK